MVEYRYPLWLKIFVYIICPPIFAGGMYLSYLPFSEGVPAFDWILVMIEILGLLFMALGVLAAIDITKGNIIVDEEGIRVKGVFTDRKLLYSQIKGFRKNGYYIIIMPNDASLMQLKISTYFKNINELYSLLNEHFTNLDLADVYTEAIEVLQDESLGSDEEERRAKMLSATRVARVVNIAGTIIGFWALFYPNPYGILLVMCMLLPVLAVVVMRVFNGIIRINEKENSVYPSVIYGFFFPALIVFLRALIDYDIYEFSSVWLPAIFMCLVLVAAIVLGNSEFNFKKFESYFVALVIAAIAFAYSFGCIAFINCYFDTSQPSMYSAIVVDKYISSGKTTVYYLKLSPWHTRKEAEDVSVSGSFYERVQPYTEVNVLLHKGALGVPWFTVEQ